MTASPVSADEEIAGPDAGAPVAGPVDAVAPHRSGFVAVNRTRLRVWEWGPADGFPVLCVHGAGDHGRMWDGFAPRLAEPGYRAVAVDLRGHGDSGRLAAGEAWSAIALDLCLLARWLSPEPIGLVGHSFGAGVGTYTASVWPEHFAWVVNLDGLGPPEESFAEFDDIAASARRSLANARRAMRGTPRVFATREEMVDRRAEINVRLPRPWVAHLVEHGSRPVAGGWTWKLDPRFHTGMPNDFSLGHLLAEQSLVSRPLLVLTGGEHDTWSEMTDAEVDRRMANLPTGRHRVVEDAGHYVHIEQPERVLAEVVDFVEEVGA